MSDEERTLNDHLRDGREALRAIERDTAHTEAQPICHHFYDTVDPMAVDRTETHSHLVPSFKSMGVDFLFDRLEAWEVTRPSLDWLETRIPALWQAAIEAGLDYEGWTWEPRDRQPLGSCRFQVINNRAAAK